MSKKKKKSIPYAKELMALGLALLVVVSIARINNIKSIRDVYDYFKAWSDQVVACGWDEAEWNCDMTLPKNWQTPNNPSHPGTSDNEGKPDSNDLDTSEKLKPPTSTNDINMNVSKDMSKEEFMKALENIPTEEAQDVDYSRKDWKHWVGTPCDARDQVLLASGKNVKTEADDDCEAETGEWFSEYDGVTVTEPSKIDIDHVIALSYAAQHGGQAWSKEKKQAFANDTSQLIAVTAKSNRAKSDLGPSEYTDIRRPYQCTFAKTWVSTAIKYGVSATKDDKYTLMLWLEKC